MIARAGLPPADTQILRTPPAFSTQAKRGVSAAPTSPLAIGKAKVAARSSAIAGCANSRAQSPNPNAICRVMAA
ncbi:hypothetical protein [Sphingomonas sp. Ant H11]|uniref:hypothetical protein n=1 Tax=Sphingomonas sp. Ant H11 TaxID=1564113 RepID=UPI0018CD38E2|nr:hypothetical protein [Sphingomonas sp. Ant H11]